MKRVAAVSHMRPRRPVFYMAQQPFDVGSILLSKRARMEGFWVADFADRSAEALERLGMWIGQGKLRYREDIVVGFEHIPAAFIKLLSGGNFGKQLVQL